MSFCTRNKLIFNKQVLLIAVVILISASCIQRVNLPDNYHIQCSAEVVSADGNKLLAENDSAVFINGAELRTNQESRTGNFSVVTGKNAPFAMSVSLPDIGPDYYFNVTIWRKSKGTKAKLVVSTSKTKQLYYMTSEVVEKDSLGWEKLRHEFFTPANFKPQEVKVNVWNNGDEDAYFDDLEIRVFKEKKHPVYKEEAVYLELDTSDFIKIQEVRQRAFKTGVLQSTDDDWVNGFLISGTEDMKLKMRLKGDWLDHLFGTKWSFRVKLKNPKRWNGLKTFSLQTPLSRHGVDEWFLHQVLLYEGILTTRYGFIPVYFNNKNLGIYAWEEHFTKLLVESQKRREGPIMRFLENALWDTRVFDKDGNRSHKNTPYFEAAVIKPFSPSKIIADSIAFNQFKIAQNLMWQYKHRIKSASEIYNIDALAKYLALCDVFIAYHSLIWHNQRFYYNPILCKLEPIAYDAYTTTGYFDWNKDQSIIGNISTNSIGYLEDNFLMTRELFNDYNLLEKYINYLEKYSSTEFLEQLSNLYKNEIVKYDSLIQIEFPDLQMVLPEIYLNAINIRNDLPTFKIKIAERKKEYKKWLNISKVDKQYTTDLDSHYAKNLVIAYCMENRNDSVLVRVVNYLTDSIILIGVGKSSRNSHLLLNNTPKMDAYNRNRASTYEFWSSKPANFLFFLNNKNETIAAEIYPWHEPSAENSPLQELEANNAFSNSDLIDGVKDGKIVFKNGSLVLNQPLIIPPGYKVYLKRGTKIDMIESAMIISYSPLFMSGTADQPILITSSDFTGTGLVVLQAGKRSKINHVIFENLNVLDYKGWTLTGAVTFYESDVDISNTLFYRNQCEDALNTIRSDFKLEKSTFDHIYGDAFDSDFCTGIVTNCRFNSIGNDAIDFSGSQIQIIDTEIIEAKDKGISGGEDSYLTVENTTILRSNIGLASKDLSTVNVKNSSIIDCNYGIVLLQKKPEYGPAKMTLINTLINNAKIKHLIEIGSEVVIDGKKIKGNRKDLADIFY